MAVPEQDTFNNEDLFNIYERDNSSSFELCSPLAAESPMNPFSTSRTTLQQLSLLLPEAQHQLHLQPAPIR